MSRRIGFSGPERTASDSTDDWDSILDSGEKIIWRGRPVEGIHISPSSLATTGFGIIFAGFALFWMIGAYQAGGNFWMSGLLHFFVGLGIAFGSHVWAWHSLRNSWYTLTNRRGIIATDRIFLGRRLNFYPIDSETQLEYKTGSPASLFFAKELKRGQKGGRYTVNVGFKRIADGDEVYRLIRNIQKGLV